MHSMSKRAAPEFQSRIVLVCLILIGTLWLGWLWMALTETTVATRRDPIGQVATQRQIDQALERAMIVTLLLGPPAIWIWTRNKQE